MQGFYECSSASGHRKVIGSAPKNSKKNLPNIRAVFTISTLRRQITKDKNLFTLFLIGIACMVYMQGPLDTGKVYLEKAREP